MVEGLFPEEQVHPLVLYSYFLFYYFFSGSVMPHPLYSYQSVGQTLVSPTPYFLLPIGQPKLCLPLLVSLVPQRGCQPTPRVL